MNEKQIISCNLGWLPLLGVAFVILKLCKVIAWPWVWVLAPIWIPYAIILILFLVYYVLYSHKNNLV